MNEKKVREAIYELKILIRTSEDIISDDKNNDTLYVKLRAKIRNYKTAIKALEKQLAKKPTYMSNVKDGEKYVGRIGRCPSCNEIVDETMLVCDCTQKLDWS